MKKIMIMIIAVLGMVMFGYGQIEDLSNIKRVVKIPIEKYNNQFIKVGYGNKDGEILGLVGENITIIKWSSWYDSDYKIVNNKPKIGIIYNISNVDIKNKTFEISNTIDTLLIPYDKYNVEYFLNGFIDNLLISWKDKKFLPLRYNTKAKSINGEEFLFDSQKSITVDTILLAKISSISTTLVVKFSNGFYCKLFNMVGNVVTNPLNGINNGIEWIGIGNDEVLLTLSELVKYKKNHPTYYQLIRSRKIKIGMTKNEVNHSWGIYKSGMNVSGYYMMDYFGKMLYFKGGKLKLIK